MKKESVFRRILSVLLALSLVLQFSPFTVRAQSNDPIYLAFTSDIHTKYGDGTTTYAASSVATLDNWVSSVSQNLGGVTFEAMGFCGDLAYTSPASSPTFFARAQTVIDAVSNNSLITKGIYTTGNHEYKPGTFNTVEDDTTLATKANYIVVGEAANTDDYIIYCFGSSQYDEIELPENLDILEAYLQQHGNETSADGNLKPIFIMTHCPIHQYNVGEVSGIHAGTAPQNTDRLISILNNYSNVILLWGHNHSNNQVNYDVIWNTIDGNPINFTYCSAGCMSDEEYNTSTYASAKVIAKGIVAEIENGQVTLTYYDKVGNPLLGSKKIDPSGTNAMQSADKENTPISVLPLKVASSSYNGNKTRIYKVDLQRSQIQSVMVTNNNSVDLDFTISTNNPLVAGVDKDSLTVKAGEKGYFNIGCGYEGIADVFIEATNSSNVYNAAIRVSVGGGVNSTDSYLIVENDRIMTANAGERSYNSNGTNYHDGLASVEFNEETSITADMKWSFAPYLDGYIITSSTNELPLNASYASSNSSMTYSAGGVWDLKDTYIRSVNATKQNPGSSTYNDKYLTYGNVSASNPENETTFIVRSISQASHPSIMKIGSSNPLSLLNLNTITVSPTELTVDQGTDISTLLTVIADYTDSAHVVNYYTKDVTDKAVIEDYDPSTVGRQLVYIKYTEGVETIYTYIYVNVQEHAEADLTITPKYDDYSFYNAAVDVGDDFIIDVINPATSSLTYSIMNSDSTISSNDVSSVAIDGSGTGRFVLTGLKKGMNIIKVHAESGNHKYDSLVAVNVGGSSSKTITTDVIKAYKNNKVEPADDDERVVTVNAVAGDVVYVYYQNGSTSTTPREYWPEVRNTDAENPVGKLAFASDNDQFVYASKYGVVPVVVSQEGTTILATKSYGTDPYFFKVIINVEAAPQEYDLEINPKKNDFELYEMNINVGDTINATVINTMAKDTTYSVLSPDTSYISVDNSSLAVTATENGQFVVTGLSQGLAVIKVHGLDGNDNYDALVAVNVGGSENKVVHPDVFTAFKNSKVSPSEDDARVIKLDVNVGDVVYFYYKNGSGSADPRVYNSSIDNTTAANYQFSGDNSQKLVTSMYSIIPVRALAEGKAVLSMVSTGNDPYYGKMVLNIANLGLVLDSITLDPTELSVDAGTDIAGMFTATAHYADSIYTKDVTSDVVVTGYDNTQLGVQQVTVSYTEGDVTKTATLSVTVNKVIVADLVINPKLDDYSFYNVAMNVDQSLVVDVVDTSAANITYSILNSDSSVSSNDLSEVTNVGTKNGRFVITGLNQGTNIIKVHGQNGNHRYDALITVNVGQTFSQVITTDVILAYKNSKVEPADDDERVVVVSAAPGDIVYVYYQNGSTSTTPREYWPEVRNTSSENPVGKLAFESDSDQFVYASMYGVVPVVVSKAGQTILATKSYGTDPYFFKVIINSIELTGIDIIDHGYTDPIPEGSDLRELLEVRAIYSDESSVGVTDNVVITGYDSNTVGNQTVTISYTDHGVTKTQTIEVFVKCTNCEYGDWEVYQQPTIIAEGKKHRTCIHCGNVEEGIVEKLVHQIINGSEFVYTKGSGNGLLITSNGIYDIFENVVVDSVVIETTNYDVVSGSIKVTLKSSYLETLDVGEHSFAITVNGADSAATKFTVKEASVNPDEPNGGVNNYKLAIATMAITTSAVALAFVQRARKED